MPKTNKNQDGAVGLIETRGVVALTAGIEAMVKTADVECVAVERIGAGYVAAAMRGSLAAVRQAVEAGSLAVEQYGVLRGAQVYAKPAEVSASLLVNDTRDQLEVPNSEVV